MQSTADKAATTQPASPVKEQIYALIDASNENTIGALLTIFRHQTASEQEAHSTTVLNSVGFNGPDAPIMTDMVAFYKRRGYLTEKQISFVRRTIKKYWAQLANFGIAEVQAIRPLEPPKEHKPEPEFKTATLEGQTGLVIKFQFPKGDARFAQAVAQVKALSGRRFVSEKRHWEAPLCLENVTKLADAGFVCDAKIQEWFLRITKRPTAVAEEIEGLKKTLYPFQKIGVNFVEGRDGRALIGDEMGLGKTIQALAYLHKHPELRPALIICPATLKLNWASEISACMGSDVPVRILSGTNGHHDAILASNCIYIINYDILSAWQDRLIDLKPQVMILDESHYIKNSDRLRTKAAMKIAKNVPHAICLSGTPIINRPIEFYNTLRLIEPTLFPSRWKYAHRYCGARHNGFGWDFTGSSNTEELHKLLTDTIMIRRKKAEVLPDLPAKVRTVLPIEIDNRADYASASANIIGWIKVNEGRAKAEKAKLAEVLVEFEKLKQLAVRGKMAAACAWIRDFLESGEKLIAFATHKETINALMEEFGDVAVKIDGSTPNTQRQEVVGRFQNEPNVRLFIGNIKAAGVGITLTAASNVCFLELPWPPGELDQAEDRAHRIGQASSVNIYYLIAQDTIEMPIAKILDEKRRVLSSVLDGHDVEAGSVLSELIKQVTGSH